MKTVRVITTIAFVVSALGAKTALAQKQALATVHGVATLADTLTSSVTTVCKFPQHPESARIPKEWNMTPASLLGVQLDIAPKSDFSAIVHLVARHRSTNEVGSAFKGRL